MFQELSDEEKICLGLKARNGQEDSIKYIRLNFGDYRKPFIARSSKVGSPEEGRVTYFQ